MNDILMGILLGLIVIAIVATLFLLFAGYQIIFHEEQIKCPHCKKWTRDKGYSQQDCDHCLIQTIYEE